MATKVSTNIYISKYPKSIGYKDRKRSSKISILELALRSLRIK